MSHQRLTPAARRALRKARRKGLGGCTAWYAPHYRGWFAAGPGTGGRDYGRCDPRPAPTRSEALRQYQRPRAQARHRLACRWWQAREAARFSGQPMPRELPPEMGW